jgi:CheY-like chemotaxis protein
MFSILCIDDTPKEIIDVCLKQNLEQILKSIYNSTPYKVVFETNGDKGIEASIKNHDIKLVLLDIEFKRQKKQGDEIAKELLKVRPDLKVIVLTRKTETGNKISFGHKINVVHYIVKQDISSPDIQDKLRNLSRAIIEDYNNEGWKLEHDDIFTTLTLSKDEECFGINIPPIGQEVIRDCVKSPNNPVNLSDNSVLSKAHNLINKNVLEGTNWKTWGILTRKGCAKGQLKLVISSVGLPLSPSVLDTSYVSKSQFDEFKKEINNKLDRLEQILSKQTSLNKETQK